MVENSPREVKEEKQGDSVRTLAERDGCLLEKGILCGRVEFQEKKEPNCLSTRTGESRFTEKTNGHVKSANTKEDD